MGYVPKWVLKVRKKHLKFLT